MASYLDKYRKNPNQDDMEQQPDTYTDLSKYRKTTEPSTGTYTDLSKYMNPTVGQNVAPASFQDDQFDTTKIEKQIENAQIRAENAGGTISQDNRNPFERALNLQEKNNWLFDAFDIISRPQQAVYNTVDAAIKNDPTPLKRGWEGFTGQRRKIGSEFMEDAGVENKYVKGGLGFALDVVADPINFVPLGVVPKAAKIVGKGIGSTVKYGTDLVESAVPALGMLRETKLEPWVDAIKDGLGNVFKYQNKWDETLDGTKDATMKNLYNQTENNIQYMAENSLRDITKAARESGGIKVGDDVGRLMEKDLKQFEDVKGYEFPDGVTRTEKKGDLLDAIKTNQSQIEDIGKGLKDFTYTNPATITAGMKAFQLVEKSVPATLNAPASTTLVRPKGAIAKEIDEIKDINGVPSYRFKGEQAFVPASKVRPVGEQVLTPNGIVNKQIEDTVDELGKVEEQIRKEYFRVENRTKNQLANRQARQPVNPNFISQNKAFKTVSESPRFNYLTKRRAELRTGLEALRTQARTARESGIEQIGKLKESTKQLKGSLDNPVVMQKEFQRPVRNMPTDPKVQQVAKTLMGSNKTVRDWAEGNGIPIGEIEGYMKHILSMEEKAFRETRKGKLVDSSRSGMNNPDKGILQGRKLLGSAEDVNERLGKKLFETNAFFSSAIGQRKLIEYGNAVKFRKDVLDNPSFAKAFKKGDDVPHGAEVINLNNYSFIKNAADDTFEKIGGEYVVTKGVKSALERYQHLTTDDGIKGVLNLYDTGMSWWKRGTLLSLPYHLRNDIGAKFNNYVAGMNLPAMAKYSTLATKDITNALARGIETPMYNEFRQQGLSSSSQMAIDFARHGDDPEKALTKIVKDQSRNKLQKAGDLINPLKIFNNSQKLGTFVDQTNRYALYRWGRETKKMTPEEAAALVRETQFDYGRITKAEKEIGTRLMPFYRWSRNNIPFQLRKFAENPARYSHVNKLRENANESMSIDDNNMPDYMRENFYLPVTGDGQGSGTMFGANLPIGDLTKLSNPGKLGLDSASSLLKLPAELVTNNKFFNGGKLQQFEGEQKKYRMPEDVYGVPIPGGGKDIGSLPVRLAYAIEQLGGQPARAATRMFGVPTQKEAEDQSLKPTLGIGTMFKKYDINESNFFQKKKELRELMEYLDYLEQETGEKPKSINDIKRGR